MKSTCIGLLAVVLSAPAFGQSRVEERHPAAPDGLVDIENAAGSIRVIGWNRDEIQVTGTLGRRAEGLGFASRPRRTQISVEVQGNPNGVVSDLEIRVPAKSRIQVQGHSASIDVSEVSGRVKAESVSGSIQVAGAPTEVEVESVSGAITVRGGERVRAEGTNASVTLVGVSGVVDAQTVNGRLDVSGGVFQEARLESVNGGLRFDGELRSGATLDVETVNGAVELRLPANLGADFTISTFNGEVDSDFEVKLGTENLRGGRAGDAKHKHKDKDHDEKELRFTTGSGGARVSITTLNGRVTLRKK
jgi:DUF4097 and DUF4098 domain-containing protein YvlB